jgi:hypothetical protein
VLPVQLSSTLAIEEASIIAAPEAEAEAEATPEEDSVVEAFISRMAHSPLDKTPFQVPRQTKDDTNQPAQMHMIRLQW